MILNYQKVILKYKKLKIKKSNFKFFYLVNKFYHLKLNLRIATLVKPFVPDDLTPEPSVPEVLLKLENMEVREGELAKFRAKILGYPKPRVTWYVNNEHAISVSFLNNFKINTLNLINLLRVQDLEPILMV